MYKNFSHFTGKFSIMSDLYILLGGGADINPSDISGLTPLHLAARLGNESLVRILMDKGIGNTAFYFTVVPYLYYEERELAVNHLMLKNMTCNQFVL